MNGEANASLNICLLGKKLYLYEHFYPDHKRIGKMIKNFGS